MRAEILNRIAAVENMVKRSETPDLIIVEYDENIEKYVFYEDYPKRDCKGRVTLGNVRKTQLKDHYSDYIFQGNVNASVIFMVTSGAERFSISFKTPDLRKSCGMMPDNAFSISKVENSTENPQEEIVYITTYERKV